MNDFIIQDNTLIKCRNNIKNAVIPDNIEIIDANAFIFITRLQTVELPYGIVKIKKRAFYDCYILKEINFPDSLTIIEDGAFANCVSLSYDTRNIIKRINPFALV